MKLRDVAVVLVGIVAGEDLQAKFWFLPTHALSNHVVEFVIGETEFTHEMLFAELKEW